MLLKNMISEVDSNSSVAHTHYAIFGISSFDIHIPAMSFNHVWSTCNVPVFFALVFALSIFGAVIPAYADSVAPTFSSTALDEETGILTITFDETIDVDTVVPTGLHIRESGSSSNSVTLSDVELTTSSDSTVISFTLTEDNRQTVIALTTPQLDIDESTVQDLVANTYDAPAFDVSTAFFVTSFSVADYDTSPQGLTFNSDGTKMFVIGNGGNKNSVYEYTLSTAFDISTATYDDVSFSVSSEVTIATDLTFNSDGTKMFVVDNGGCCVS